MATYAIVAPDFETITNDYKVLERIKALYAYPKWKLCKTEAEALTFIRLNKYKHHVRQLYNYGDTFRDMYVNVKYIIFPNSVFYTLDTSKVGHLRINCADALVEYRLNTINIRIGNLQLSNDTIAGHMSAIHHLLNIVGDFVDLNITLPNYSIFYSLTYYNKGRSRAINITQDAIRHRLCKVAFTLVAREEEMPSE